MRLPWQRNTTAREPTRGKLYPGQANVRIPVRSFPQEAPEPGVQGGAYGLRPGRPAQVQVFTSFHDQQRSVSEGRFVAVIVGPNPRASYPRGRQSAFGTRTNIAVPTAVAYGSLFVSDTPAYGIY